MLSIILIIHVHTMQPNAQVLDCQAGGVFRHKLLQSSKLSRPETLKKRQYTCSTLSLHLPPAMLYASDLLKMCRAEN